ncbi:MAG TPA: hypothetical protein VEV41_18920, partial [Terriglobales bacterium]|nr:hypothetical protein [Terriglobales bacterium]
MKIGIIRSAVAATVVLAAATVWAQSAVGTSDQASASRIQAAPAKRPGIKNQLNREGAAGPMRQRMQDMATTLNQMHALLKQMRAKAAARKSQDSLVKANLDMWELMLNDLDKQFEQLRAATLGREDLEARRADLYRQADDKAAAQRAQALAASQAMVSGSAG